MKNITIPLDIPSDLLIALNESEQELKNHFQVSIAMMLFQEGKLTLGKAIQLSGLNRYEFEKSLSKKKKPKNLVDNKKVAREGGTVAKVARKEIEKKTGESVVTSKNARQLHGSSNDKTIEKE